MFFRHRVGMPLVWVMAMLLVLYGRTHESHAQDRRTNVTTPAKKMDGRAVVKVVEQRPRIFLRPDDLPAWRKRFRDVPELKAVYAATRKDLLAREKPHVNPYVSSSELMGLAMIYLVEDRSPEFLARTKRWMDVMSENTLGDHWGWPLLTKAMSVAYDWTYQDLTAAERKRYGQAIIRYAEATLSYADHDAVPAGANWSNQVSDYFNQFYWHHGRVPFAGLALSGEKQFAKDAERYLSMGDDWIKNHMMAATNQAGEGGGWFEGLGYNGMTMPPYAELLEAWRTGTGENLLQQSKVLPGNAAWVFHGIIPHSGKYLPLDDIHFNAKPGAGVDSIGAMAPLLAARYRDGYAQHFTNTLFPARFATSNIPYLMWYDGDVAAIDVAKTETARKFDGLGQINARSGWGADDSLLVFRAGRVYGGHGQISPGHFLFYRKGNLLIEDGYYGAMGPEAHNTLYVGGEPRKIGRGASQHFLAEMDGSPFDFARITNHTHKAGRFDWMVADLSRSYTAQQATSVTRSLAFLHPRTLIVIDSISSSQPAEKRFRLHAPEAPTIDTATRTASWQEDQGKLYVQTLLPEAVNQAASKGKVSHLYSVTPRDARGDDTLVQVLYAADLNEAAPKSSILHSRKWTGAQVLADTNAWVLWFPTDHKPSGTAELQVETTSPVRHLVTGLSAGKYKITGPGAPGETFTISIGEPLHFETKSGGTFSIKSVD